MLGDEFCLFCCDFQKCLIDTSLLNFRFEIIFFQKGEFWTNFFSWLSPFNRDLLSFVILGIWTIWFSVPFILDPRSERIIVWWCCEKFGKRFNLYSWFSELPLLRDSFIRALGLISRLNNFTQFYQFVLSRGEFCFTFLNLHCLISIRSFPNFFHRHIISLHNLLWLSERSNYYAQSSQLLLMRDQFYVNEESKYFNILLLLNSLYWEVIQFCAFRLDLVGSNYFLQLS